MEEEIRKIITDNFVCDTQDQLSALVDLIVDQIQAVALENLTIEKIRSIIEQEITIFMRMNGKL